MTEIDDSVLIKITKSMNDTISSMLYGGSSDPGQRELMAAAACYNVLKLLNLKINDIDSVFSELSGENINDYDYLRNKRVRKD